MGSVRATTSKRRRDAVATADVFVPDGERGLLAQIASGRLAGSECNFHAFMYVDLACAAGTE